MCSMSLMEHSLQNREHLVDTASGWSGEKNEKIIMDFDGQSGLQCDYPELPSSLDMFNVSFDDDMWDIMCRETNRYAHRVLESAHLNGTLKTHSRITRWVGVTIDEMKVFLSMVILIGIVKKAHSLGLLVNRRTNNYAILRK